MLLDVVLLLELACMVVIATTIFVGILHFSHNFALSISSRYSQEEPQRELLLSRPPTETLKLRTKIPGEAVVVHDTLQKNAIQRDVLEDVGECCLRFVEPNAHPIYQSRNAPTHCAAAFVHEEAIAYDAGLDAGIEKSPFPDIFLVFLLQTG
jgi:hypothetical protein